MVTRQLYNTLQYVKYNTTDYLVIFCGKIKVNKTHNVSLIQKGVQGHGMRILYLLHDTGFETLTDDENTEAKKKQEKRLFSTSSTLRTPLRPGLLTLKSASKMSTF